MNISDCVIRAQRRLRMAQSLANEIYSEGPMIEYIQSAFDYYFNLLWWPQFKVALSGTLNGTSGLVVADLSANIRSHRDIRFIWPAEKGSDTLARWPENRRAVDCEGGTEPRYWEPFGTTNKFRVLPLTSIGDIEIWSYPKPANFTIASTVDFDETLLSLNAALRAAAAKGANSMELSSIAEELREYWKVYKNREFDDELPIRNSTPNAQTEWV